jgi:hypothetical protein
VLTLFVFSALLVFMPAAFRPTSVTSEGTSLLAIEILTLNDIVVYQQSGDDETFHGYSSLYHAPDAPQWNVTGAGNDFVEVWFGEEPGFPGYVLELRHVTKQWLHWRQECYMQWYYPDGTVASTQIQIFQAYYTITINYLDREAIVNAWNPSTASSAFTARCPHISTSIVLQFDPGKYDDIGEAYDAGEIIYVLSYEWAPENTGFAVLAVIGNLLTFRGLGLGLPGVFGLMVEGFISMTFYMGIIWVAYKIITGLIPFVSGGGGT